MGEAHPRTMDGSWGPGGDVSWPVECLLNGMSTQDAHLMFGNNNSHNHELPPQFRHRYQAQPPPPMHISSGLPLSSSINVSIPSHPMVEESGQPQELSNVSSVITGNTPGQDRLVTRTLPLTNEVLDDTDEASDEEEEDEVDEELAMPHSRRTNPLSHQMGENSLAQCQQQIRDNLPTMMSMPPENHCHHKLNSSVILRNGLSVNGHPLQQLHSHQPSSMMPMFSQMEDFEPAEAQANQGNNDPNSGYSVYGKMYFEGRIVLHLKQGTCNDGSTVMSNNGMNFSSCEEQKGQQFHGCAACRLRSPGNQENLRRQRDSHRHTIKGVLFTFEDCTIVELYPDQLPAALPNDSNDPKPSSQTTKICIDNGHPMPMNSYMVPVVPQQGTNNPKHRLMQHMEIEQIQQIDSVQQPNIDSQPAAPPHQHLKSSNPNEDHTSWWAEFESDAEGDNELKETESTEEESNPVPDCTEGPLSCMNHKLNQNNANPNINSIQHEQHIMQKNNNDEDDQENQQSEEESCNQYAKYKCSICSNEFVSRNQLDSHICLSHSLEPDPNSTSSSLPPPLELDLSSSSNSSNSNNASFESNTLEDRTVTTPTPAQLENHSEISSAEEDSCHSALNIAHDNSFEEIKAGSYNNNSSKILCRTPKRAIKHQCSFCGKHFHLKRTLEQHLKENHSSPTSEFKCSKCNAEFNEHRILKQHNCIFSNLKLRAVQKKIVKPLIKNLQLAKKVSKKDIAIPKKKITPNCNANCKYQRRKQLVPSNSQQKLESPTPDESQHEEPHPEDFYCSSGPEEDAHNSDSSNTTNSENSSQDDEYEDQNELVFNLKSKLEATSSQSSPSNQKSDNSNTSYGCNSPNKEIDGKYECEVCGKCFSIARRLETHKRAHRKEKSSICEKCGKKFARKDKLMRHMYVHSEEKMFACPTCDKRFSRRDKLTDHLKSHGGEDDAVHCPMCKKEFLRPDILKQHIKMHGMGNKYQCPECLRFVTGKERLEKHMAKHEEAKALGQTLVCPLCTKYFIQRQSLKAHIKKFHADADISIDTLVPTILSPPPLRDINTTSLLANKSDHCSFPSVPSRQSPSQELDENDMAGVVKQGVHSCRQCSKQFSKKIYLKKHQRKNHHEHNVSSADSRVLSRIQEDDDIEEIDSARNMLESPINNNDNTNSDAPQLNRSNVMLSLASHIVGSPMSTHSPPVTTSITSTPFPAHIPLLQPLTPPQLTIQSLHNHHHHHTVSNSTTAPPAHIPLTLAAAAAAVSASPSISQQNNVLGVNGQGSHSVLHAHSSHHLLQHTHHTNPSGLSHPGLSCSHGQMHHAHLGQHLSMSPLQSMSMTPPPAMFYYSPYSYQQ